MRRVYPDQDTFAITQGEYALSKDPCCVITTILGSCISTCLWDPEERVGGMNHILVARSSTGQSFSDLAGINAMELLINGLVREGASRAALRAKVFGGARMISGLSDIGQMNAVFALDYLEREGIPCLGRSLGGTDARQVRFFPAEGRVFVKSVSARRVKEPERLPPQRSAGNDIELF